jgi:hypothetical protein
MYIFHMDIDGLLKENCPGAFLFFTIMYTNCGPKRELNM